MQTSRSVEKGSFVKRLRWKTDSTNGRTTASRFNNNKESSYIVYASLSHLNKGERSGVTLKRNAEEILHLSCNDKDGCTCCEAGHHWVGKEESDEPQPEETETYL